MNREDSPRRRALGEATGGFGIKPAPRIQFWDDRKLMGEELKIFITLSGSLFFVTQQPSEPLLGISLQEH